jgi:hypothetical protein
MRQPQGVGMDQDLNAQRKSRKSLLLEIVFGICCGTLTVFLVNLIRN